MHALILAAAAALPAVPPDGAYTYSMSVAGNATGNTTITSAHTAAGLQLAESASASYGGSKYDATSTLNLDALLLPTGYAAVYKTPRGTIHASVAFNGPTATETADGGNTSFQLDASTTHFAVLDGTMFSGFFILPSQLRTWNAQAFTTVAPMFFRSVAISLDRTLKPNRPAGVPATDVVLSVSDPVEFTLWYDPATLIVDELDVPAQAAQYIRLR